MCTSFVEINRKKKLQCFLIVFVKRYQPSYVGSMDENAFKKRSYRRIAPRIPYGRAHFLYRTVHDHRHTVNVYTVSFFRHTNYVLHTNVESFALFEADPRMSYLVVFTTRVSPLKSDFHRLFLAWTSSSACISRFLSTKTDNLVKLFFQYIYINVFFFFYINSRCVYG